MQAVLPAHQVTAAALGLVGAVLSAFVALLGNWVAEDSRRRTARADTRSAAARQLAEELAGVATAVRREHAYAQALACRYPDLVRSPVCNTLDDGSGNTIVVGSRPTSLQQIAEAEAWHEVRAITATYLHEEP